MRFSWVLFFLSTITVFADSYPGKVTRVFDGNTVEVLSKQEGRQKLVLSGIDAPDAGQPFADKAQRHLEKLVLGKEVEVTSAGKTRTGDQLAVVILKKTGVDPRIALLENGLAWTGEKNPDPTLEAIRLKALAKEKGLWKESDPTAPWIYRRQQSMMRAKSS